MRVSRVFEPGSERFARISVLRRPLLHSTAVNDSHILHFVI
jgi:hypothetical protein